MTECLICEDDFRVDETNEHRIVTVRTDRLDKGDRFGVCPSCRAKIEAYDTAKRAVDAAQKRSGELEAQLAAQATHAAIGRAVSKIPRGAKLHQSESTEEHYWVVMDWEKCLGKGSTPLDALRAAGLTEE